MSLRVLAASPADLAWIVDRTECGATAGARGIKAVDEAGTIRGMVMYDGWTKNAVHAHMAVDSPIVWRALLLPAFAYPFEEQGREIILGTIPSHNKKSVAMVKAFGFRESHRIKDGWARGDDLLMFEMRRNECRFLQRNRRAA